MAALKNILRLFAVIGIVMAITSPAFCADDPPQTKGSDYRLETGTSAVALYPRLGYRSSVSDKDTFSSLADLEQRVSRLPAGSRITWQPYERNRFGSFFLFPGESDLGEFTLFCHRHEVELIIAPPNCAAADDCKKYCEGSGKGKECMPDGLPVCSKNECSCSLTCL